MIRLHLPKVSETSDPTDSRTSSPAVSQVDTTVQTATQSAPEAHTAKPKRKVKRSKLDPDRPLTAPQRAFLTEYLKDFNATEALARIGRRRDGKVAHRYLHSVNVQKALNAELERRENERIVTMEDLRKEYGRVAMMPAAGPLLWGNKLQAMKDLGSHLGMFKNEAQAIVPVQFLITGGPDLPTLPTEQPKVEASPSSPLLTVDKPEPKGR